MKTTKSSKEKNNLIGSVWFDYWSEFLDYMQKQKTSLCLPPISTCNSLFFASGRTHFQFSTRASNRLKRIGICIYLQEPDRLKNFDALLRQHRKQAEEYVGMKLDWRRLPHMKESHIELDYPCDPSDRTDWPKQFEWLSNAIEKTHAYFSPVFKRL